MPGQNNTKSGAFFHFNALISTYRDLFLKRIYISTSGEFNNIILGKLAAIYHFNQKPFLKAFLTSKYL